jgi:AcrR family transcriptional regulator
MPRISKQREEAVRSRILEASVAVFERRGFAGASMAAIATEAGMSAGAPYTYFSSKEELFLAAFALLVEEEERALEEAISQSPLTAYAIDLAIDYMAGLAAGGDGLRGAGVNFLLHAWATAERNDALAEMLRRRRARANGLSRTVVEGAIARGELPADIDVDGLASGFVSMLDGFFLQRAEQGQAFSIDDARRQGRAMVDAMFRRAGTAAEVRGEASR